MTDRKKPGVAFWATVVLVIMLAYPLSFGPACWITSRNQSIAPDLYMPFGWLLVNGPDFLCDAIKFYVGVGMAPETVAYVCCDDVQLTYVNSPDIE